MSSFKLFGRSNGYYLFWTGFIYFCVGTYLAVTHIAPTEYATLGFVLALSVPLWCPPVARYFNMEPLMFNLFDKKDKTPSNVVPFPEPKQTPKMPYVVPPAPKLEPTPTVFYTFGITDDNRVTFTVGHTTLTMNHVGVQSLIDQLEFFKNQISDHE